MHDDAAPATPHRRQGREAVTKLLAPKSSHPSSKEPLKVADGIVEGSRGNLREGIDGRTLPFSEIQ